MKAGKLHNFCFLIQWLHKFVFCTSLQNLEGLKTCFELPRLALLPLISVVLDIAIRKCFSWSMQIVISALTSEVICDSESMVLESAISLLQLSYWKTEKIFLDICCLNLYLSFHIRISINSVTALKPSDTFCFSFVGSCGWSNLFRSAK